MSKTKIGSNAIFSGPQKGLTVIEDHCYAYSGSKAATDSIGAGNLAAMNSSGKIGRRGGGATVVVPVNIDGKEVARVVARNLGDEMARRGAS